jgi:hypothetical protein
MLDVEVGVAPLKLLWLLLSIVEHDGPLRDTEQKDNALQELHYYFLSDVDNGLDFDPLGKGFNGDEYMLEASFGLRQDSHDINSPDGDRTW